MDRTERAQRRTRNAAAAAALARSVNRGYGAAVDSDNLIEPALGTQHIGLRDDRRGPRPRPGSAIICARRCAHAGPAYGRKALIGTTLLLCALFGGCASPPLRAGADNPARVTNSINLSGFSPEYKRGFSAGCENVRSGRVAQREKGDAAFARGWRDGRSYCSPKPAR